MGINPDDIVGNVPAGCDVSFMVEVVSGLASGVFVIEYTRDVAHLRIVRGKGFTAGRTTGDDPLSVHRVNAGVDASAVVDVLMRVAMARKLDTLPIHIPRYLTPNWLEATGMVIKPVLAHTGGKVYITMKPFQPAPVVPVSPEKLARQAENRARAGRRIELMKNSRTHGGKRYLLVA